MNVIALAALYNTSNCTVMREINSSHGEADRRHTYLLSFGDGQEIALKICRNLFTTTTRVNGWQTLCEHYRRLGIYCPRIVNSLNGNAAEMVCQDGETFVVYAEELKKHRTMEELDPCPDYNEFRPEILKAVGKAASDTSVLLPWPSVYCLYDTFDTEDEVDENYQNAKEFCDTIRAHFPQHAAYADKIWMLFLQKREEFEPVYRLLSKASFQSDLNETNVLVDNDGAFAGLIDFNLCGTACVLYYILLPEVCGYRLQRDDIDQLSKKSFRHMCDAFLLDNLRMLSRHYTFSDMERKYFNLCYNTAVPFCYYMINDKLHYIIKENKPAYGKVILDWVYDQLSRDDLALPV